MRPRNDTATRLRGLDDIAGRAALLPDVPEDRLARLHEIRLWSRSHDRSMSGRLMPRQGTPEAAAIEREIVALHQYIEEDRRAYVIVGKHWQSTTLSGAITESARQSPVNLSEPNQPKPKTL
ncbi:hypothetical protein [Methylorubrum extorquens]|jgi:hypothetical protein|uniref:Uncharacterized protein n=3 Tax=Methylorubrum extorquens TaxID=408 RepID=C5B003_METEA|nr:hypothetical protein [Methylorubrum extorquens]ACS41527.1 hypothetical protein MexAM1_META1p3833 [Methylorubrum extorquens AM1]MCP1540283.1 hypothetical protein [Methylorubrum extorquens]MCP1587179.1 hypothetical protein [Methylorubrum extorquens]UYW30276.1 hypothetical protein OKB92_14730 [Methylorubrum extorquens]CAX26191.1 protein of unknown function [Methylorubrum extorquens DM4]